MYNTKDHLRQYDTMEVNSLSWMHFCTGPGEEAESDVFHIHHCTACWKKHEDK